MAHFSERLADFFYGELSALEMNEGRRHLAECAECRTQYEQFERTHHALKALPELDPPRQIVFGFEKRPLAASWISRWLAPMAASAAVAFAVVTFVPGPATNSPQPSLAVVQPPPAAGVQPVAATVDYDRIVSELSEVQRAWLIDEIRKLDLSREREIQRIKAELAYYEDMQRAIWKDTFENAASIQLLAQQSGPKE
jgi:hypothetical protein